jgi:hypothetical protein
MIAKEINPSHLQQHSALSSSGCILHAARDHRSSANLLIYVKAAMNSRDGGTMKEMVGIGRCTVGFGNLEAYRRQSRWR